LDHRDVSEHLAKTITEVGELRQEWVRLATALGEQHLDDGWRQVRNIARRCGITLADVVGRYERAGDQVSCDVAARTHAQQRAPVAAPPAFTWGIVRRGLGLARGRTCMARWAPVADSGLHAPHETAAAAQACADVATHGATSCVDASAPPDGRVGDETPGRRWTLAELQAIRARAEAQYEASKQT
jgi:hypothetical protein